MTDAQVALRLCADDIPRFIRRLEAAPIMSKKALLDERLRRLSETHSVTTIPTTPTETQPDADLDPEAAAQRRDARLIVRENERAFAGEPLSTNRELREELVPSAAQKRSATAVGWLVLRSVVTIAAAIALLVGVVTSPVLMTTLSNDPLFELHLENAGRLTEEELAQKVVVVMVGDDFRIVPSSEGVPAKDLKISGSIARRVIEKAPVRIFTANAEWDFLTRAQVGATVAPIAAALAAMSALAVWYTSRSAGLGSRVGFGVSAVCFAVIGLWGVIQMDNALIHAASSLAAEHNLYTFNAPTELASMWTYTLAAPCVSAGAGVIGYVIVRAVVAVCSWLRSLKARKQERRISESEHVAESA